MKLRSITARAAGAGAVTALIAGGLVAATSTTANAVSDTTNYACALASPLTMDLGTFSLNVDTPVIPPTATAGQSFPAGLLNLTATLTIPAPTGGQLASFGVDHADAPDYAVGLGSTSIGAPIAFGAPTVNQDGSATVVGTASNQPFTLPAAGDYTADLPGAFTLNTEINMGSGPIPAEIDCVSDAPGNLGAVQVTKGLSSLAAKAGKHQKVTATVKRIGDEVVPGGKVIAKVGTKSYTQKLNSLGKAVFKLPKSAKGKKATITYKGDAYTAAAKPVKLTVK